MALFAYRFDHWGGTNLTSYFIVGTKYHRAEDMLPTMLRHGVVAVGFEGVTDFRDIVGLGVEETGAALSSRIPKAPTLARNTLAQFLNMRPGDIVALKSHSAPRGRAARLVIARYAVVTGKTKVKYGLRDRLGHTIEVDFLAEQDPIELPYGYGRTLHKVVDQKRISAIFGRFHQVEGGGSDIASESADKATHTSVVDSRGSYIMNRVHNELQNKLRERLETLYGKAAVKQEFDNIDLSISFWTVPGFPLEFTPLTNRYQGAGRVCDI